MNRETILKTLNEQLGVIKHLCAHGVQTDDDYDQVLSIIDLFKKVEVLTKVQRVVLRTLVSVTGDYEEIHFPFGN